MTLHVAPIVEGETEERCVKILLSGIWREFLGVAVREELRVLEPNPANRSALLKAEHPEMHQKVEQSVRLLKSRMRRPAEDRGFVLLSIDADEDCPATVASQLLTRAKAVRSDADFACVLAKRELENWFKAAATSLAGTAGLPEGLTVPRDPETGSGDTWLTRQMRSRNPRRKYTKPGDAVALAERMDLQQCRDNSRSFRKLCKEFEIRMAPAINSMAEDGTRDAIPPDNESES